MRTRRYRGVLAGAAVAASLATAVGGLHARAWVRHRVHYDAVPAVAEDVAALALVGAAVRSTPASPDSHDLGLNRRI